MAYYFDENRRLEWIDDKNIAYQEQVVVKKESGETELAWKNIAYYPHIEMAFKYFVLDNIRDAGITNDFEEVLDKIAVLLDKYQSIAKTQRTIHDQNQTVIKQNEEIIELKKKELDNRLKLDYDVEEDEEEESEGLGWNY